MRVTDVHPDDPFRANNVLMRALGLVGTPYRWGGNTPEGGFDCSGLVNYVFRDMANVALPRTSRDLAAQGPRIQPERLAAADLELTSDDLRQIEDAAARLTVQGARYPEHMERMTNR